MKPNDCNGMSAHGLDFLWLELTSQCNLYCRHCYSDSGPRTFSNGELTATEYEQLIVAAKNLGCKKLQFIGGEPTLVPALPTLIELAYHEGFEFIEVFTNAVHFGEALKNALVRYGVHVAISFYSVDPQIHDAITNRAGSHRATLTTLRWLLAEGVPVRAGIIVMPSNKETVEETKEFLIHQGITDIGVDRMRGVGRGQVIPLSNSPYDNMSELCGKCWRGSVCVSAKGVVYPCIMARQWPVGSVRTSEFAEIVESSALRSFRQVMRDRELTPVACGPQHCSPCNPSVCNPTCPPHCSPACSPQYSCQPKQCWPRFD